jgi:hypothetical protein
MPRFKLKRHALAAGTDTTPDAFTFTDVPNVPVSTTETSNTITIAGLGTGVSVAVSVVGGAYSQNGGSYVSSDGTAQNGDTFAVRHTSSAINSTSVNTTLTVGGVSDTFTSTTEAASGSVVYDTSVGNGVFANGSANLPLRIGGTDGTDLSTTTPSLGSNMTAATYGTDKTITSTSFGGTTIATWTGLTVGQQYRVAGSYNITSFGDLYGKDAGGTTQVTLFDNPSGSSNNKGFFDLTFTATGTSFVLKSVADFFAGSITMVILATNTGGVPAHRFIVNGSTGSNTRDGVQAQSTSTPLATIAEAMKYAVSTRGDQILVADNQNYSEIFPNLYPSKSNGFSAVHPFVIQTYDPTDPTNEAKYGRPDAGKRPKIGTGGATAIAVLSAGGTYLAIRGFDFDPGNLSGAQITFNSATNPVSYVLLENNIFRCVSISFDCNTASSQGVGNVFRMNSYFGAYSTTAGIRTSGLYCSNIRYTQEDCVAWHCGWKLGVSRDTTQASGGIGGSLGPFCHSTYSQGDCDAITRRCLIIDNAADGGHYVGPVTFTENVSINNPYGLGLGGNAYNVYRPSGSDIQISYNAFLGDNDINSANPLGIGVQNANGTSGSSCHHNIIARSRNPALADHTFAALGTNASYDQPSYMNYHDNVIYNWRASGYDTYEGAVFPLQVHATYNTNIWDDPASGTNVNKASVTFPNAYTVDGLVTALGYSGADAATRLQALVDDAKEHPESFIQREALSLAQAGYGI